MVPINNRYLAIALIPVQSRCLTHAKRSAFLIEQVQTVLLVRVCPCFTVYEYFQRWDNDSAFTLGALRHFVFNC